MRHARKDYDDLAALDKKIGDDEPVILIRAKDPLAPDVARYWAGRAKQEGVEERVWKAMAAWGDEIQAWRENNLKGKAAEKLPDVPKDQLFNE